MILSFIAVIGIVTISCAAFGGGTGTEDATPDLTKTALAEELFAGNPPTQTPITPEASTGTDTKPDVQNTPTPKKETRIGIATPSRSVSDFTMGFLTAPTIETIDTMRPGGVVVALRTDSQPVIDGDPGDWEGYEYSANIPVYGEGYYLDAKDISGSFKLGWDSIYLYIGIKVSDNQFAQIDSGKTLFLGDSLEILMDTQLGNDFDDINFSDDDYYLGISPGNVDRDIDPELFVWRPETLYGSYTNARVASAWTTDGYYIEAAIPWSLFNVSPQNMDHFGFAFSVSDNDTAEGSGQQTIVSHAADRKNIDPTTWAELHLAIR
ncbi:MAG: hypothetical protein JXA19_06650 [Anaerolineales bacterium]|nr:hypothetical protein [Anaerolineales bacterium]